MRTLSTSDRYTALRVLECLIPFDCLEKLEAIIKALICDDWLIPSFVKIEPIVIKKQNKVDVFAKF